MPPASLSSTVTPRQDVLEGALVDAVFAANLDDVVRGQAPAVYGEPDRFFAQTFPSLGLRAQRGHIPPAEPPPAPGPFNLASAQRLTALLRGAGFTQVRTEEVPMRLAAPDADQYLALIADIAGPTALALRDLSQADRAQLRAEVEDSLRRFTAGNGFELPGLALCAVAG